MIPRKSNFFIILALWITPAMLFAQSGFVIKGSSLYTIEEGVPWVTSPLSNGDALILMLTEEGCRMEHITPGEDESHTGFDYQFQSERTECLHVVPGADRSVFIRGRITTEGYEDPAGFTAKFDSSGVLLWELSDRELSVDGNYFAPDLHMAVSHSGLMLIFTQSYIQVGNLSNVVITQSHSLDINTGMVHTSGYKFSNNFADPLISVIVSPDGRFLVHYQADEGPKLFQFNGIQGITLLEPEGNFSDSTPYGLHYDEDGNFYLLEYPTSSGNQTAFSSVQKFNTSMERTWLWEPEVDYMGYLLSRPLLLSTSEHYLVLPRQITDEERNGEFIFDAMDLNGNGIARIQWSEVTQSPLSFFHELGKDTFLAGGQTDAGIQIISLEVKPQGDADEDGILDPFDNCPDVINENQIDIDENGIGDACEGDVPDNDNADSSDVTSEEASTGSNNGGDCAIFKHQQQFPQIIYLFFLLFYFIIRKRS